MLVRAARAAAVRPAVTAGALSIGVSLAAAAAIARAGSPTARPVLALLVVAGALLLLSFRPETLLFSWLGLAPFLQGYGSHAAIQHPLGLALYLAPPLVFLLWTLTARNRAATPGFVDVLPLAYFLFLLGSLMLTADPSSTTIKNLYLTVGIGVILYYFVALGPGGSVSLERLITLLLLLAALEALMSIVDGLTGWNLWHDVYARGGIRRAVATLGSPAALGTFIGMGVVLAVSILVWNGPSRIHRLAVVTIVVGLPGLFFTYTRAPILATIVAASVVLASRAGARLFGIVLLVTVIAVAIGFWGRFTSSSVYQNRIAKANTVQIRVELERWSLKLAGERPLFGWGYDSFDRAIQAADLNAGKLRRSEVVSSTSHNTFLTILVQYGSIGLVLFVLPWIVIVRRTLVDALSSADGRWLLLGSVAAIGIYAFAASSIDFRFFSFVPAIPWLLLGVLRRLQRAPHRA
jgi:O-antigen ligase